MTRRGREARRTAARAFAFASATPASEVLQPTGYSFGFAEPEELDAVARVVCGARALGRRTAAALRAVARDPNADIVVARRNGAVVGAAVVRARPINGLHLPVGIRVAPEHRRVSLIRYLLHVALMWCRVTGVATARLPARGATAREHAWIYRSLRGRLVDLPAAALPGRARPA